MATHGAYGTAWVIAEQRASKNTTGHLGEPLLELVDQARLAAAGVADDRHDLRQRAGEAVEARRQLRQLLDSRPTSGVSPRASAIAIAVVVSESPRTS